MLFSVNKLANLRRCNSWGKLDLLAGVDKVKRSEGPPARSGAPERPQDFWSQNIFQAVHKTFHNLLLLLSIFDLVKNLFIKNTVSHVSCVRAGLSGDNGATLLPPPTLLRPKSTVSKNPKRLSRTILGIENMNWVVQNNFQKAVHAGPT